MKKIILVSKFMETRELELKFDINIVFMIFK